MNLPETSWFSSWWLYCHAQYLAVGAFGMTAFYSLLYVGLLFIPTLRQKYATTLAESAVMSFVIVATTAVLIPNY